MRTGPPCVESSSTSNYVRPCAAQHARSLNGVIKGHIGAVGGSMLREAGHKVTGLDTDLFTGCDFGSRTLSYFDVELEDHQVILAEGAPVESALGEGMIAFAPIWFGNRKSELASRLRSAVSPWVDRRKVADRVRDRLDARGDSALAA